MPIDTIIGGRSYTQEYINDPRNQEEIRLAVVNGGNNIYNTNGNGLTHNTTGNTINANSTGQMTSTGATYTNQQGTSVTPYSERNSIGTTLAGSVFDPNSSNFNSVIANSSGRINMRNEGDYDSSGNFTGRNSGSRSEADSQAYYNGIMNSGGGSGSSISGSGSYNGDSYGGGSYGGSSMDTNARLVELQKAKSLAGLQGAYNSSLANLNQQDSKIDKQAFNDRALKSTQSQLGAKSLQEYLAARGQTSSGVAGQTELNRGMQLQGDVGSIDLQARGERNNINTNKTNLSNALATDTAAANAGIEADSLSRQMQLIQQEQARQDQINQFNQNYALSAAGLTGNFNGQQTLQGKQYDYNINRDTIADNRYDAQNQYSQSQDLINQTGQFANGQYTQAGQLNNLNMQTQQAQLSEMQNPNSTTNQLAQLGLQTARLNYAALPQQLQAQAQQVAQQLRQGAIDMRTAQVKLDYLPQMMQQEITQNNAQISATNRSNQGGSGGGSTGSGGNGTTKTQLTASQRRTETLKMAEAQERNGTGTQWLNANAAEIKAIEGADFFKTVEAKIKKTNVDYQIGYDLAKLKAIQQNGNLTRE